MLLERVEPAVPQPPVGREPRVELPQGRRRERVHPALCLWMDVDEARVAQDLEVLGRRRLADVVKGINKLADRARALQEQIEDPHPGRLGQHGEKRGGGHAPSKYAESVICLSRTIDGRLSCANMGYA